MTGSTPFNWLLSGAVAPADAVSQPDLLGAAWALPAGSRVPLPRGPSTTNLSGKEQNICQRVSVINAILIKSYTKPELVGLCFFYRELLLQSAVQ